jgi:hypothetical protein
MFSSKTSKVDVELIYAGYVDRMSEMKLPAASFETYLKVAGELFTFDNGQSFLSK